MIRDQLRIYAKGTDITFERGIDNHWFLLLVFGASNEELKKIS